MNIAYEVAYKYSSCRQSGIGKGVGAVVVKNNKVITYGYNGVVDGVPMCTKETCLRLSRKIPHGTRRDECWGDCAEKRAIVNAYKNNINIENARIYVTKSPCVSCCKLLINLGIKEVIYDSVFSSSEFSFEILSRAGIKYRKIKNYTKIC
jgi:dCMP deaminase